MFLDCIEINKVIPDRRNANTKRIIQRSSRPEVFCKKGVLKNFANFSFIKKETLAQVFSCEFCEIFKNTFFYLTPPVAASATTDALLLYV